MISSIPESAALNLISDFNFKILKILLDKSRTGVGQPGSGWKKSDRAAWMPTPGQEQFVQLLI